MAAQGTIFAGREDVSSAGITYGTVDIIVNNTHVYRSDFLRIENETFQYTLCGKIRHESAKTQSVFFMF